MKKIFFSFVLITSILSANAGWVVKGISAPVSPEKLTNYTLTFNGNGDPIAAGTMFTSNGSGMGLNTIVIIHADPNPITIIFPITFPLPDDNFDIEVRDFHYYNDRYVLCGSKKNIYGSHAFVAVIDGGLISIDYIEHPEVEVYYSNCLSPISKLNFDY